MGRSQYLVVRTYSKESERIYTRYLGVMVYYYWLLLVFLQTDTVSCMVATSRLYVTVSYGFCMVAASDLYSTVSYGGAVQTPGAMCTCRGCTISQQNRVVRTSAFGCLNWAGSISFVRTF